MRTFVAFFAGLSLLVAPLAAAPVGAQGAAPTRVLLPTDRTVLPIPEPAVAAITEVDARKATPPPRFEVKAPANAPNVLIVLIDDMGFGQLADSRGVAQRAQPPCEQHGVDHGDRYRVSRSDRPAPQQRSAGGRDAAAERV